MYRCVLLVVLWLFIGTRSRLFVIGLLVIAEALRPSLCLFGTNLVTLCLMVWDWRVSRAEQMLSCWHNLLFLFCLLLFYLFLPSMGWLCGVGVFGLIECPHSFPALHSGLQNNNNNTHISMQLVLHTSALQLVLHISTAISVTGTHGINPTSRYYNSGDSASTIN